MDEPRPVVYQSNTPLHPELQQMLKDNFTLVGASDLDRYDQVRGLFASGLNVNDEVLTKFPALKVIGNFGVGYDQIDVKACTSRGVRVGNTPDVLNGTTADMAFTLLLAMARRVCEGDHISRDPATKSFDLNWFGYQVSGQVIGIVGMGRIGREIAKRAKAFSMSVLYHNRHQVDRAVEEKLDATYVPSLHALLGQSDFVVVVVPGGKENVGFFGETEFAAMKKTAIFVNISRGVVVDQDALVAALSSNQIAGAGLDVTTPEPLPRDHPLLKLPNVIITPHVGSATLVTRKRMLEVTIQNIHAGIRGEQMPAEVFK